MKMKSARSTREESDELNPSITVYTTTLCPVCGLVKNFFNSIGITYKEVNVDVNPLVMITLIRKTGKLTLPQTNINGKWISGFDPVKKLRLLNVQESP